MSIYALWLAFGLMAISAALQTKNTFTDKTIFDRVLSAVFVAVYSFAAWGIWIVLNPAASPA